MKISFADKTTEKVFSRQVVKGFSREVCKAAYRKLLMINAAETVQDLRVPPGNRLEKLKGDLEGSWSIRVNNQFRIVFEVQDGKALNVRLTDYHD